MGRAFRPRGRTILPVLLCLSWAGCSSRPTVKSTSNTPANPNSEALRDGDETDKLTRDASATHDDGANSIQEIPFRDAQSLPVGTLLTVRLSKAINSDSPQASTTFAASVDEPVVIEGATIVPRGASVAGRIEAARSSAVAHNRGYVRLTLDLVDIAGRELPVRTASLFTRGNPQPSGNTHDMVFLEQGRRLTFRLAEPIYMASQSSDSHR